MNQDTRPDTRDIDRQEKKGKRMTASQIKPVFTTPAAYTDTPPIQTTLTTLSLKPHIEGGFFAQTDRSPDHFPSPSRKKENADETRAASTMIFYYLTPRSPLGAFHRNASRTIHTLHRGRGRYVILHGDAGSRARNAGKAVLETFVVGHDIARGERLQWVVEGGDYKASFLLGDGCGHGTGTGTGTDTDNDTGTLESNGLLISEVVVPGFEYADHDFLRIEEMRELLDPEQVRDLDWMLRKK